MGYSTRHLLTNVSNELRTGDCSVCGAVSGIVSRKPGYYCCPTVRRRNRDGTTDELRARALARKRTRRATPEYRESIREYNRSYYRRHSTEKFPVSWWIGPDRHPFTESDYLTLQLKQGNACAICSRPAPPDRRLATDHDHSTGEVRGLLCHRCNTGIGLLGDTATDLLRATGYLTGRGASAGAP